MSRLQRTTFANILLYLPQLVQALRYEGKGNDMLFVNKAEVSSPSRAKQHSHDSGNVKRVDEAVFGGRPVCEIYRNQQIDCGFLRGRCGSCEVPHSCGMRKLRNRQLSLLVSHSVLLVLLLPSCHVLTQSIPRYLKVEVEANEELDEPVSEMYAQMIDRLKRKLAQGNNTARQALATTNTQKVSNAYNVGKYYTHTVFRSSSIRSSTWRNSLLR